MALTAATAFIRLNIVGFLYMLCLFVIVVGKHTLVARVWVVYVAAIAVLAIFQVQEPASVMCAPVALKNLYMFFFHAGIQSDVAMSSSCHRPLSADNLTSFPLQYMSLVYIPPSLHDHVHLPWGDWSYKVKLYCFLPPGQPSTELFGNT